LPAIVTALMLLPCLPSQSAEEILVDAVVAVVDGTNITLSEVRQVEEALLRGRLPEQATAEQIAAIRERYFRDALDNIIDRKLILNQAEKLGIIVLDREVDEAIRKMIEEGEFRDIEHMLEEMQITKTALAKQIKDDKLYRRIIRYQLHPKVRVSPQAVRDYYQEHIENYREPEKIHLYAITFFAGANPEEDKAVIETAEKVLQELRGGADFSELAKQYSMDVVHGRQGGDWGWIDREGNVAAEAAFELPINELSDIVKTSNSYWILKVAGKKAAQTVPLAQVWEELEGKVRLLELVRLRDEWTKKLRKDANIIYPLSLSEKPEE